MQASQCLYTMALTRSWKLEVRKSLGMCDKVSELNLSALCKRRKEKQEKDLNYILYFVPNFQSRPRKPCSLHMYSKEHECAAGGRSKGQMGAWNCRESQALPRTG